MKENNFFIQNLMLILMSMKGNFLFKLLLINYCQWKKILFFIQSNFFFIETMFVNSTVYSKKEFFYSNVCWLYYQKYFFYSK